MEFIDFKRAVYKQFDALANNADRLYLTNVNKDELWDCYINSYPEDERQSHTCNCCRQFIKPYGNVAITGRFNANVVTRRYGLRQQVLYLMYYGIEYHTTDMEVSVRF